ncbi:MAG: multiheme c-type cytochrome [Terriglobales bacterium]
MGSTACATCHPGKFASYRTTSMFHAAETVADATILRDHPTLKFQLGPFQYTLQRVAGGTTYTITRGSERLTLPVVWAFGLGTAGQTYVLRYRAAYYESRVSFYTAIQALDLTMGYPPTAPSSIEEAIGRRLPPDEARACIGCHTTGALRQNELDIAHLTPGVGCENCHSPGATHVQQVKAGIVQPGVIFNPGNLDPDSSVDFCGSCHRTALKILGMHLDGPINVRFQPYRLENSKCWDPTDRRIACIACHDPHQEVVHQPSSYDAKCLACHVNAPQAKPTATHPGSACPVARNNCVTCHMPKVDLPGAHHAFTDHDIRIARAGAPYPN